MRGMGMTIIPAPVHKLKLTCGLVSGEVKVGVHPALPAAFPLCSTTAKAVLKALSQFISVFDISKVIQTDQGSKKLVSQVLQQLQVKHNQASAYHPQSQGALERFHQTLKSMLRAYCTELGRDWEEGLPWLLLAARELFSETPSQTHLMEHDIVIGEVQPIRQRFYCVSPDKRAQLNNDVKYMLENKIAEPSNSSWASPCVLVKKT